jgi:hypothetical protein
MAKGQSDADRIKEHTLRSDKPAPTTDEEARLHDPKVNYFGPDKGPFKCGHCKFFDASGSDCEHPDVNAPVDADGCCNLYVSMEDD